MKKTKKQDPFETFSAEACKWVDYFGLYNWEVNLHTEPFSDDNYLAYTMCNVDNKRADIYLALDWGEAEMTEHALKTTAFHEVCEVLLASIRHIAAERYINDGQIDGEIHSIIRILTAKIFEGEK